MQGISRRRWMLDFGSAMFVTPGIARAAASSTAEAALQPPGFDPRSIWITDLTVSRPAEAHSRAAERGRWRLVDYKARTGTGKPVTGTMLMCGPETAPPAVSIPLQARGWHAIYVGLRLIWGSASPTPSSLSLRVILAMFWPGRNCPRRSHWRGHRAVGGSAAERPFAAPPDPGLLLQVC